MRHRFPPPAPFKPATAQAKRAPPAAHWSGGAAPGRALAPSAIPPRQAFRQTVPGARAVQRATQGATGDTKSASSSSPAKKPAPAPVPSTDVKDPAPSADTKDVKADTGAAPALNYQQRKKLLQQQMAPVVTALAKTPAKIVILKSAGNHYHEAGDDPGHPSNADQLVECVCWHLAKGNFEVSLDAQEQVTVTIQLDVDARNPRDKKNWRVAGKLDKDGKLYVRHCGPGG
jgi:hypothetical protein